ncbi:MAG TPA: aspartate-semialdehyde dehydrogenase [Candidatus Nanoarchaeia archaeon]|nr:aspartate-semialdehyde dehydrogenase [Candidatus Nanoarchaeia archaeon]
MEQKIRAGILGATGAVGQKYIELLAGHPWFEITFLAASKESSSYRNAVAERGWFVSADFPENIASLRVHNAEDAKSAKTICDFVFSALESGSATKLEPAYAAEMPVVSNTSAYRKDPLVPVLIPEINPQHLGIIPIQKKERGYRGGFIVVKPNCSLQSYITPIHALMQAGYAVDRVIITTLQASSGAGVPGVPSLSLIDNVVPFIDGEEAKTENEPYKILGKISDGEIKNYGGMKISATCTRVPVRDGHMASVSISFNGKKPAIDEIIHVWESFGALPQEYDLPFAPKHPIIYRDEENRPQPILDRGAEKGMAVTVGRLRECPVFDYKFIGLSHNTIRGAAGGGILNAELLVREGYIKGD